MTCWTPVPCWARLCDSPVGLCLPSPYSVPLIFGHQVLRLCIQGEGVTVLFPGDRPFVLTGNFLLLMISFVFRCVCLVPPFHPVNIYSFVLVLSTCSFYTVKSCIGFISLFLFGWFGVFCFCFCPFCHTSILSHLYFLICFRLTGSHIILLFPLPWKAICCSFASSGYPDSDSVVVSQAVWCKQAQTSLIQTHITEAPLFHHCDSYVVFTQLNSLFTT